MADVIDLAAAKKEREPHISGALFCMACSHEWQAVWPLGVTEFECPECHCMRGRSKFDISPGEGKQVWQCVSCSNQLFNLLPDRVHCPGCGQQWGYDALI